MVLALKNGSSGLHRPRPRWRACSARSSGRSCGCLPPPARGEALRATQRSIGRSPDAIARRKPRPQAARLPRSAPGAGARPDRAAGTDNPPPHSGSNSIPGRLAAAQSSAARMPASGPGKFSTVSAMTGSPNAANRAGSPLALRMRPSHCGASRAITRARMVLPPIWRIGLSPPPIRRARPPASSTPGVGGASLDVAGISVFTIFALALVARGFLFDESKVLIVDDPLLARQAR